MKLPIKKKYFDEIKCGDKHWEFRDSHITFMCEETGEELTKSVVAVFLQKLESIPHLEDRMLFDDDVVIVFELGEYKGGLSDE